MGSCREPDNRGSSLAPPLAAHTVHALLVEDSERLRRSIGAGLRRSGWVVDCVADGRKGLSYARLNPYDVLILDLGLPELDGLDVLAQLRAADSKLPVLILTARDAVADRVAGLRAGADDYLIKPFDFEELLARLDALVRRAYQQSGEVIDLGGVRLHRADRRVECASGDLNLTRREYSLIEYLALRRGAVVSRVEIEDHIYDEHSLPSSNAVDSAVCSLRAKLSGAGAPELIRTVRGLGYVVDENRP